MTGLLQHEAKLSVLNFGVKKVAGFAEPIANKQQLLFVCGFRFELAEVAKPSPHCQRIRPCIMRTLSICRSFMARPIFSTDEPHADKHKLERFLHPGRHSVATVYAPITYGPQPLLVFSVPETGTPRLAASGALL